MNSGAASARRLRDEILSRFTGSVSRITAADDPDGLLRETGVLAALEEYGFQILFFDEPVAFRFAYETRVRAAWDRGERFDLVVAHSGGEPSLPFDVTAGAQMVSLRLDDFFPHLSSAVVRELDPADRDRLFPVQAEAGRKALGDDETRDFVLRRLFGVTPETIHGPADLLALLSERHYAGRRFPESLDDRLVRRLRRKKRLAGWPLRRLLSDRESFFAFLGERWPLFLAGRDGGTAGSGADTDALTVPGPRALPFGDERVRAYLDNLFVEGFLKPVEHPFVPGTTQAWIRAGVVSGGTDAGPRRLERLLEVARSGLPAEDADHRAWLRFARRWAETRAALLAVDDPPPAAQSAFDRLEANVDEAFAAWLPRRYGALSSLPPLPPVMLHHVPHRIARDVRDSDGKAVLIVADGLALPQWVMIRDELTRRRPRYSITEDAVFAWVPTITAVSRQATFAGRPPFHFAGSIDSTAREPALWTAFWQSKGISARHVPLREGARNQRTGSRRVPAGRARRACRGARRQHCGRHHARNATRRARHAKPGASVGAPPLSPRPAGPAAPPGLRDLADFGSRQHRGGRLRFTRGGIGGRSSRGAGPDLFRRSPGRPGRRALSESEKVATAWPSGGLPPTARARPTGIRRRREDDRMPRGRVSRRSHRPAGPHRESLSMRDPAQKVGIGRLVRLSWLEETASLVLAGNGKSQIHDTLDRLLTGQISVGGNAPRSGRAKAITVLMKTWLIVPGGLEALRDDGLRLLNQVGGGERIAVHWGMLLAAYPFWGAVAARTGRQLRVQGRAGSRAGAAADP